MSSPQLPNYLRANRKTLALSQSEVAFLLGAKNGDIMCRHERFNRVPNLETALAYEVIFKRSVSELFGGLYQQAERDVAARAKILSQSEDNKTTRRAVHRREVLARLAN